MNGHIVHMFQKTVSFFLCMCLSVCAFAVVCSFMHGEPVLGVFLFCLWCFLKNGFITISPFVCTKYFPWSTIDVQHRNYRCYSGLGIFLCHSRLLSSFDVWEVCLATVSTFSLLIRSNIDIMGEKIHHSRRKKRQMLSAVDQHQQNEYQHTKNAKYSFIRIK